MQAVITGALADAGVTASQVAGVGITNQRETSVVWNKKTGKPYHNASTARETCDLQWRDSQTISSLTLLVDCRVMYLGHNTTTTLNSVVWSDTRTQPLCDALCAGHELGQNRFAKKTGLPVVPYFSATKIMWLLENVDGYVTHLLQVLQPKANNPRPPPHTTSLRAAAESGEAIFGTMDTWVAWNLTGGTDGGIHITGTNT